MRESCGACCLVLCVCVCVSLLPGPVCVCVCVCVCVLACCLVLCVCARMYVCCLILLARTLNRFADEPILPRSPGGDGPDGRTVKLRVVHGLWDGCRQRAKGQGRGGLWSGGSRRHICSQCSARQCKARIYALRVHWSRDSSSGC